MDDPPSEPVVFAAAFFEHAHLYGQCEGLVKAGARLKWFHDPDPRKVHEFQQRFPAVRAARCYDEILNDSSVKIVAAAAVPNERAIHGCRALAAGKDYFTDKTAVTSLEQLREVREAVQRTGRKYLVYFSEQHLECVLEAAQLIAAGAIGRVVQVIGLAPHTLRKASRPDWFFDPVKSGGILCDLGGQVIEQFLALAGATDAEVTHAFTANHANPDKPGFEDFGEATLTGNNGTRCYLRVDWLSPTGLSTWGDGRTIVLGTRGYLELRKYVDLARHRQGNQLYLVDEQGESHVQLPDLAGASYFEKILRDCVERSETAMTQAHVFKATELSIRAQNIAHPAARQN